MNNYVNYLTLSFFVALYIICFVYSYKNDYQIISTVTLSIFHLFFFLFLCQVIATFLFNKTTNLLHMITWFSVFLGSAIELMTLLIIIVVFKFFHGKYDKNMGKMMSRAKKVNLDSIYHYSLSPFLTKDALRKLTILRILFITTTAIILFLLTTTFLFYDTLNVPLTYLFTNFLRNMSFYNFTPLIIPMFIILLNIGVVGISLYEFKMALDFYNYSKKII